MANNYNVDILKKLRLDVWHDLGYDGSIGLSATAEGLVVNNLTDGWWSSPYPREGSDHALKTALVFHVFAPGRKLVSLPGTNANNSDGLYFASHSANYILNHGIDTFFRSLNGDADGMDNYLSNLPFLTYINSGGNGGEHSYNTAPRNKYIYGVGAIRLNMEMPASWSSHSPYIDFAMPDGVYIPATDGKTWYPFNGTSCAAPALAGMCACINHFFLVKRAKPLKREKMYEFLKDCSKDIWDKGKDNKTGWGLPILPHPDSIDIDKYAPFGDDDNMIFSDTKNHWNKDHINAVTNIGLMQGYPDGTFKPDKPLTRAEAVEILYNIYVEGKNGE